ncbi:MAG TPA: DUF3798 domain-containing protein [Candidatus Limnocylindrales bacterium]|nr:DUF3798 domain-containing protein [Candidatus Limnocylindrales bacterium]
MPHPILSRAKAVTSAAAAAVLVLLALASCQKNSAATTTQASATPASTQPVRAINFKIGVMTGTVSQGEDEFRAGQMIVAKYGADHVKHVTYPDNFMQEQETVIAQLVGLASDPQVKVIVAGQAIPGCIAALRKIREKRPDIKVAFIAAHEDPAMVNEAVDVSLQPDELARGRTIIDVAKRMGVTDFVHYSFPRHMSQELLARRRDIMKQAAAENGIKFHFVTAPDPMGEGGLNATQQFVMEDVPRELKTYGQKTAFFSTNCGMMDPMIKSVLTNGGYIPEQCCPSPTHGYPTALGIAIPPDKAGDMEYISAQNRKVIAEHGMTGHFATWPVPEVMLSIRAMTDLLVDATEGKADYKDPATVKKYMESLAAGHAITLTKYDEKKGNSYLFLVSDIYY